MIIERLNEYITAKGLTIAAFERSVGMANASFAKALKNNRAIGTDKLENILTHYPDISALWLLRGVGDMFLSDDDEHNILQSTSEYIKPLLDMIKEQGETIQSKMEEIGQLKERIRQLEQRLGKDAANASTAITANVG
ncbi:MAG: hypothetical protein HDS64_01055 [Bacteroidales bacterium]|nr:hypothetical protein [Bacteroidales bacterium]